MGYTKIVEIWILNGNGQPCHTHCANPNKNSKIVFKRVSGHVTSRCLEKILDAAAMIWGQSSKALHNLSVTSPWTQVAHCYLRHLKLKADGLLIELKPHTCKQAAPAIYSQHSPSQKVSSLRPKTHAIPKQQWHWHEVLKIAMPSNIVKRFAGSTLSLSMDLTTFMPTSDKWEAWKFASMIKYVQGVDCLACTPLQTQYSEQR